MENKPLESTSRLIEFNPVRKAVAARVVDSIQNIPQFDTRIEIEIDKVFAERAKLKSEDAPIVPSINDYIIEACARTLVEFPNLNSHYSNEGLLMMDNININFAAASKKGAVLLPVVFDADKRSVFEIAEISKDLSEKARDHKLRAKLQMYGTFTISNLGAFGIDSFNAIINPPQTAILAVGGLKDVVVVDSDSFAVKKKIMFTLTVDHRVLDGADAAMFLAVLKKNLERKES